MKDIIRIKDMPSNTIEEAIIILKDNIKIKKHEYTNKFNKNNDNDNYIVKEAEFIISDYLNNPENKNKKVNKTNKRLKIANVALILLLILSIIF